MLRAKISRRAASYALILLLTGLSVLAATRTRKPFSTQAPAFREKGPANAKVQIVEFSDFQCPACRYAEPVVRQLFPVYGDKIRFIFKHFPLRMHQWAKPAAVAAECAGRQGKFWEYHDRVYDRQAEWTNEKFEDFLTAYAVFVRLDMKQWQACRQDPSVAAVVASDEQDGENAWVDSTPTFFINGRRFVGAKQLAELGTLHIDRELKK
jgi:protein-disulfide isomerase